MSLGFSYRETVRFSHVARGISGEGMLQMVTTKLFVELYFLQLLNHIFFSVLLNSCHFSRTAIVLMYSSFSGRDFRSVS